LRDFLIIAGPQAAGKSTTIKQINTQCQTLLPLFKRKRRRLPVLFSLQESRQIIIHKNALLGAIFMTVRDEIEVIECDLARMGILLSRASDSLVYLDECNIFTIAHAAAHGITEVAAYWQSYVENLKSLQAKVVFLNVPPEVSWQRREESYRQRLVYFPRRRHTQIMRRYREYMFRVHPLLLDIYHRLPFPKEMIDANQSQENVVRLASQKLARVSNTFK